MELLDKNKDGMIDFSEFMLINHEYPMVISYCLTSVNLCLK